MASDTDAALRSHLEKQAQGSRNFFWHRLRWALVRAQLPSHRGFTVIDVGAGAGLAGEFLRRDHPDAKYFFIEPIGTLRQHLRDRFGPEADLTDAGGRLDGEIIILLDVLEHQENDAGFLEGLLSRMSPSARLIITVPALKILWSRWDEMLGHYRRYDKPGLLKVIGASGGHVVELDYVFPEMLIPALFRKWKSGRVRQGGEEFPDLPDWLNDALVAVGRLFLRMRAWIPIGTSIFAVVRRPESLPP